MRKLLYLISSLLSLNTCYAGLKSLPPDARVDSFIHAKMKELDIPGMAVGIVKNGKVVKISSYGLGNLEWKAPVTAHTSFQIASCSKLLASTIVMKSVYEHKLDLEDPIGKYIDSIPAAWQDIRVKHLLSHSSGLKLFTGDPYIGTDRVVRSLKDSTLAYAVGSKHAYVSSDYTVLRYLLEKLYAKPYEQLVKEMVALPAGMNDGGFDMEKKVGSFMRTDVMNQKATTYYGTKDHKYAYKFIYPDYTYTAGGYFASVDDMCKWAVALDKGLYFPQTLERSLVYEENARAPEDGSFSRVGWVSGREDQIPMAGHSGGPGLGDVLRFPDQGYTFIVLSNDGELLPAVARSIASFYIKGLKPKMEITKFKR